MEPETVALTTVYEEFDWLVRSLVSAARDRNPERDLGILAAMVDISDGVKPDGIFNRFIIEHNYFNTIAELRKHYRAPVDPQKKTVN